MKFLGYKATVMPLAVAATLAFGVPQAGAQGLFDMLFGGGVRHDPQGEFPPPPKRKPKPAVSGGGTKISSPSYYSYKADRLVRQHCREPAGGEPSAAKGCREFRPEDVPRENH